MSKRYTNTGNKNIVSVYLDDDTHALLVSAKNRSGRTKSTEVAMRLKDHLRRFDLDPPSPNSFCILS